MDCIHRDSLGYNDSVFITRNLEHEVWQDYWKLQLCVVKSYET